MAESIRAAVTDAERGAQVSVDSVTLGIGGMEVRGAQSRGLYEFGRPHELDSGDLEYAVELAAAEGEVLPLESVAENLPVPEAAPAIPSPANDDDLLRRALEGLLFITDRPLSAAELGKLVGVRDQDKIIGTVEELRRDLEAKNAGFGERGVVDFAARLAGRQMFERHVFGFGPCINQRRMTLIECAAPRVLPGEPHGRAGKQQRSEREGFGHAVIHWALAVPHFGALFE